MKKSRDEVIFETLINKMLDPHGINIEDIRDSTTWFYDYTWSYKESLEYRKWAIDYLSKSKRTSKKLAQKELQWFNLTYGLKYSDDPFSEANRELGKTYKSYW